MKNLPKYKTVDELYTFMEAREACQEGLAFLRSCKTLEQAYACVDTEFWQFAVEQDVDLFEYVPAEIKNEWDSINWRCLVETNKHLFKEVPSEIKNEWDSTDWAWVVLYQLELFKEVPSEIKNEWTPLGWGRIVETHPSLKEFSPYHN